MGLVTEGKAQLCRATCGAMGFQGKVPDSQDPCLALLTPLGPVPRFGSTNRSETAKAFSVRDVWVHAAGCWGNVLLGAISGLTQLLWGAVSGQAGMPSKGREQKFRSCLTGLEATGGCDEKLRTSDLTHL